MNQSPTMIKRRNYLLIALGGLAVLIACGAIAHNGKVGRVERGVFRAINDLPEWVYRPMWVFQQFGNIAIALLIGLVIAAVVRNWRLAVAVLAAGVLKLGIEKVIKQVVERRRPGSVIRDIHMRGDVSAQGLSFVSGHAVMTAAIAGLVTPVLPRAWRVVPWMLVALNGVVRIYVGAHNPLDVVGGVGAGLIIAGVLNCILLPEQIPSRWNRSTGASSSQLQA